MSPSRSYIYPCHASLKIRAPCNDANLENLTEHLLPPVSWRHERELTGRRNPIEVFRVSQTLPSYLPARQGAKSLFRWSSSCFPECKQKQPSILLLPITSDLPRWEDPNETWSLVKPHKPQLKLLSNKQIIIPLLLKTRVSGLRGNSFEVPQPI